MYFSLLEGKMLYFYGREGLMLIMVYIDMKYVVYMLLLKFGFKWYILNNIIVN